MKLILNKKTLRENSVQFMRSAGYNFDHGIIGEEMSFTRVLAAGGYPRFHVYVNEDAENLIINLHIDQKKPSYGGGSHAHSGEYDGDLVNNEMARIRQVAGA